MQAQMTQLRGTWMGLPRRAQIAIAGVALVTLVILMLVVRTATHTDWVAATNRIDPSQVESAQKALDKAGVSTQVGSGATSVMVPKSDLAKASAALAAQGIGGRGARNTCEKMFGSSGSMIASTSAKFARDQLTCTQNELSNNIEMMDGIQNASVALALPSAKLFTDEQENATASVQIDTGSERLPSKSVRGIQAMVAASVDSLPRENVTVTDDSGSVLTDDAGSGSMSEGQFKLKVEAAYNAGVEQKLTSQYEKMAGPGNVIVTSRSVLDMDEIKRTVNEYGGPDGKQGPVGEEKVKTEVVGGDATGVQGIAGLSPNNTNGEATTTDPAGETTTTDPAVDQKDRRTTVDTGPAAAGAGKYLNTDAATTYNNNQVQEAINVAKGGNVRDGLGIVVDDSVPASVQTAIKNNAMAWLGGDAEDAFSFEIANFTKAGNPKAASAVFAQWATWLKWGLLGIGLIGMAFFLRRTLNQRTAELMVPNDDLLLLEPGDFEPMPLAELEAAMARAAAVEPDRRVVLQRKVEEIADDKPHDVANELRRWMHQDDQNYATPSRTR